MTPPPLLCQLTPTCTDRDVAAARDQAAMVYAVPAVTAVPAWPADAFPAAVAVTAREWVPECACAVLFATLALAEPPHDPAVPSSNPIAAADSRFGPPELKNR